MITKLSTLALMPFPSYQDFRPANIKGCQDRYGLDTVIDNLRRYCFNPNILDSKTKADA